MLLRLLKVEKDKVVERKNNMSKYNLTDILNEYVGGGRIGTLKISYKDLVDKMDDLEQSGNVVVRERGSSADGKVNREFEVVGLSDAVPGGNKQEVGFTVYDYKFGFDPGDEEHFDQEYNFSVGGTNLALAQDLGLDVKPYNFEENINEDEFDEARQKAIESSQEAAGIKEDAMKISKKNYDDYHKDDVKKNVNEGDLFSSEFDRGELKDIINDLNKDLILDMPTRRAYKFLVSLLDKEDKKELGVNEQMFIDDDEFEMEMGRSKKDSLKKEMMIHVDQLIDGNIDMNDFMNVVEEIMAEVKSMKEVMNVDRKGKKKSDKKSNLTGGAVTTMKEEIAPTGIGISGDQLKNLIKLGAIAGVEVFVRDKDGKNVRKVDYTLTNTDFEKDPDDIDYIDENEGQEALKEHFTRFMFKKYS